MITWIDILRTIAAIMFGFGSILCAGLFFDLLLGKIDD